MRARLDEVGLRAFYADAEAVAKLDAEEREAKLRVWATKARAPTPSGDVNASG